jgi:sulfatase maturation enzyme AslB (radical SAM superfamily)
LKIKQHLGSEQARMEEIKATVSFRHKIDATQRDEFHIPSFEKTLIEHLLQSSKVKKEDGRLYPSIA